MLLYIYMLLYMLFKVFIKEGPHMGKPRHRKAVIFALFHTG